MKYGQATQLKIDMLWHEIGLVKDSTLRVNMMHTFEKLLTFLDEEFDTKKIQEGQASLSNSRYILFTDREG